MIVIIFLGFLWIDITWTSALDWSTAEDAVQTCHTPGCYRAGLDPCDNFYKFACSKIEEYKIPEGSFAVATLGKTRERVQKRLKESIESKMEEHDPETLKKLQSHYNSCLDTQKLKNHSTKKLLITLRGLGDWPVQIGDDWDESSFDWKILTYKLRRFGFVDSMNAFVSLGIEVDEKNTSRYVITLDEAVTGLDHQYLIQGQSNHHVMAYYKYMVRVAETLGVDTSYAETELAESLQFEINLAQISLTAEERRNGSMLYNDMTVGKLDYVCPGINWIEYINHFLQRYHTIGTSERVIVKSPSYLKALSELISRTPKRVIANYAIWRAVQESVPFMNDRLQKIRAEFMALTTGTDELLPRSEQCIDYITTHIPVAAGALYVRKVFDKSLKTKVTELVDEMLKSFKLSLEKVDWIVKDTRIRALRKLQAIHAHVAYPEELLDDSKLDKYFSKLKRTPNDYLDSYLNVNLLDLDDLYQQLRKPNNKTDWLAHSASAVLNAYYQPTENSIDIPAGFIQKELFALDRPNYMNYGALGWVIGHELTHAFDDLGSRYDENGNLINWWTSDIRKEFQKRVQCIVDQYNNYTVLGMKVNGVNTQGENLADIGGIKHAYQAYEEYEKKNGVEARLPRLPPYTPRQLFWISAASVWCEKLTPEALRDIVMTDQHCPSEFRVIGAFSNMPEFSRDFKCRVGSRMNPQKKCTFL